MITLEQAKKLKHGDTLHHMSVKNADGTPARCRVNGKIKLWKTRPNEFRLPVKHGLRDCFYLGLDNADSWELPG